MTRFVPRSTADWVWFWSIAGFYVLLGVAVLVWWLLDARRPRRVGYVTVNLPESEDL